MKRELKDLSSFTFKDTEDKELNLKEFFEEDDFYTKTKGKTKQVIGIFVKHTAIQRLAQAAGVVMTQPTMLVTPSGSNEQQHLFTATFSGAGYSPTVEIGEASTRNTSMGISRNYMGTMGFKRLFDRGVLAHLGFLELYSQEEADDLNEEQINVKIAPKELEAIGVYLNDIVNAKTVKDLDKAMKQAITDRKEGKIDISNAQRSYLRTIYQSNRFNLEMEANDIKAEAPKTVKKEVKEVEDDNPLKARAAAANAALEKKAQDAEKGKPSMTAEEHAAAVERGDIPF